MVRPNKEHNIRAVRLVCALAVVSFLSVGFTAWAIRAICSTRQEVARASSSRPADPQSRAQALLVQLTTEMEPVLAASRHVLLGQRPGNDPTCITQRLEDNRILLQGSPTGGAGLRLMAFYAETPDAPLALYAWSQEKLRPFLQSQRKTNTAALAGAEKLAATAHELAAEIRRDAGCLTPDIAAEGITSTAWPAECLRRLGTAIAAGEISSTQTWADELDAATFALADLHRWFDVLLGSHLTSLGFQARCREAFVYAASVNGATSATRESSLPAAGMMVAWGQNYLEVEHQAEGLFAPPEMAVAAVTSDDLSSVPSARWMPPDVRHVFRWLRSRQSPAVQAVWDRAATTPLDRSYLANILFRAMTARAVDELSLALQRFEQSHRTVTQTELMDVLFYRSGFYSSGFHWADRYDRRILKEAGDLVGDQEAVARQAHQMTNGLLKGWRNYGADMMTLTQALDIGKLDCVSGTDMIGALYRDAGHGEYAVVRLRCGTTGHSVGAIPIEREGERRLLIVDSLRPSPPSEVWPSAYFQELTWPEGFPGLHGPLFCAELYVRGLDGYLFAEGYVVRGESAGQLVRAALPYLPDAQKPGSARIFDGPYPPVPARTPPVSAARALSATAIP